MNDNILWLNKLVPKHVLLKESDIEGKLSPLNITRDQLPKILLKDPGAGGEGRGHVGNWKGCALLLLLHFN